MTRKFTLVGTLPPGEWQVVRYGDALLFAGPSGPVMTVANGKIVAVRDEKGVDYTVEKLCENMGASAQNGRESAADTTDNDRQAPLAETPKPA